MGFKQNVMMMMGILLILSLGAVGYSLYKAKNSGTTGTPVVAGECPDYWIAHQQEDGTTMCVNEKDLGTCTPTTTGQHFSIDFASAYPDDCSKYTWAQNCNISWDGITYGVPNPCDSSS